LLLQLGRGPKTRCRRVARLAKYSRPWHTIVCHDRLEGLPPKIGCGQSQLP
jgi:hypothetical protein